MKRIYESFEELANAMTNGEGRLHSYNCPGVDGCLDWQNGVLDFAGWLDHIGMKVKITDGAENFYDYMRRTREEKQPRES